jgi:hypothetical protein
LKPLVRHYGCVLNPTGLIGLAQGADDVPGGGGGHQPPVEPLAEHCGQLHDTPGWRGQGGEPVSNGHRERLRHDGGKRAPHLPANPGSDECTHPDQRGEQLLDQER